MYISIDLERLVLLHKHPEVNVVCDLVLLEAPDSAICVMPQDDPAFSFPLTDMELGMLYRNTTGDDRDHNRQQLRALVQDLTDRLPVMDVNPFELDRQIANRKKEEALQYVKGSYLPGKPISVFGQQVEAPKDVDAVIERVAPKEEARPAAPAKPPASPQPAPIAPAGGMRATVWDVADQLWEREGRPTGKSEVLALRKRMMEVLETDHGVKRTSSSNELGKWQKNRIPPRP